MHLITIQQKAKGKKEIMRIEEMINQYNGNADYLDLHTGYTYHIQKWANDYKKLGVNSPMKVSENGGSGL